MNDASSAKLKGNKSSSGSSKDKKKKKAFKKPEPKPSLDHLPKLDRKAHEWGTIIGEGAFGKVFRVTRKSDGQVMACKAVETGFFSNYLLNQQITEIENMQNLSGEHSGFLITYDVCIENTEIFIFTEICEGGTLENGLGSQKMETEADVQKIVQQLFDALDYLHSKNIGHMDLKLDNIAFVHTHDDKHEIRLLDFGVSTRREEGAKKIRGMRGTPPYMAPELLMGAGFTEQADMWSMGVIMYQLLTGQLPFKLGRKLPPKKKIKKLMRVKKLSWNDSISKDAKDVIKACLRYDAAKRPTPNDILKYPWFHSAADTKLTSRVLEAFEIFMKRGKLQKALTPLIMIHVHDVDKHLIQYAQNLHASTAKDANGGFDFEEFKLCLAEIEGQTWTDVEARAIFDEIDEDGSGEVDLAEFMAWFSYDYVIQQDERIWKFIKTLDKNKDGYITLDEIEDACKETHPEWAEYMKAFEAVFEHESQYAIEDFAKILLGDVRDVEYSAVSMSMSEIGLKGKKEPDFHKN